MEKHTQINGAMVNSDTGQLTLDTGTLGFSDIQDHDTATSAGGQVGIGLGLQPNGTGQPGQPSGTVSGSYASHTIEQVTKATIGAGTIVIRNEAKQKQDVTDINRDVDQAQVITKNEREGVQVYASSDAVKTLATTASTFIDKLVETGKLTKDGAGKVKDVLGALKDVDPSSFALCGGQQGFNLFHLLVTPAYADGGCKIRFAGREGVDLSPEAYNALRQSVVSSAEKALKAEIPRFQTLLSLQASGTLSASQAAELGALQGRLQEQMAYFELCTTLPGGLGSSGLIPPGMETMVQAAEAYRKGGDAIASQVLAMTSYTQAQLKNLRQDNPQLAMAAFYLLYDRNPKGVDAIFQLNGATQPDISEQTRSTLIASAASNFAQVTFQTGIGALQPKSSGLIASMQMAVKGLSVDQQIAFAFQINQYASAHADQVAGSVKTAQAATAVILGAAGAATIAPAAAACLQNPVCLNETAIALGELATGDALGGGTLGVAGWRIANALSDTAVRLGVAETKIGRNSLGVPVQQTAIGISGKSGTFELAGSQYNLALNSSKTTAVSNVPDPKAAAFSLLNTLSGGATVTKQEVTGGIVYTATSATGQTFTVRSFSKTSSTTGVPEWTLDLPRGLIGGKIDEIKFR